MVHLRVGAVKGNDNDADGKDTRTPILSQTVDDDVAIPDGGLRAWLVILGVCRSLYLIVYAVH